MTLWIQPLFGDPIEVPFSPPMIHWRAIYQYLQLRHFPDKRVHQLRLFRDSFDLSDVQEGETLHLLVTDPMVERWVSEYSVTSKDTSCTYHYSTVTWLDRRWGDPYQDPSIQYRTPLILHIVAKEHGTLVEFRVSHSMNPYGGRRKDPLPEETGYPTLREACVAFRNGMNQESQENQEVCTENTVEHIIHLWELYHGTNQHLADQGRYYDY